MNGFSVRNLDFGFRGSEPIFSGFSYDFEKGSLAITGPSGCGKSTLLNLLQGRLTPNAGSVVVLDQDLSELKTYAKLAAFRRENLGIVFQQPRMISELDARTNVALAVAICGGQMATALTRADELLTQCGVVPDQPVTTLSGGQLGRVSICRALIHQPKLVLADEPSAALDAKTAHEMIELLLDFPGIAGLVLVTHDKTIAGRCDQILELSPAK